MGKGIPDEGEEMFYFSSLFLDIIRFPQKKTQMWLKCQKHVDILRIDYFLCPACVEPTLFAKESVAGFWHLRYKLKTANISRQSIGFCASSAIWASLVSFIIRLLLVQPSFSSSLGHKRPPVRSTWSVNINLKRRTLSIFENEKCTHFARLLNDRTVHWH